MAFAAVFAGFLLLAISGSVSASGIRGIASVGADSWSNGRVTAQFNPSHPAVVVQGQDSSEPSVETDEAQIAELRADGTTAAIANLDGTNWSVKATTVPGGLLIRYDANPLVRSTDATGSVIGTAVVELRYTLGNATASDPNNATSVKIGLTASSWPWTNLSDSLAVFVTFDFPNDSSEKLAESSSTPNEVDGADAGTGTINGYFRWEPTALATYPNGSSRTLTVVPSVQVTGNEASIWLRFNGAPGGYTGLSYDPRLGLLLHPFGLSLLQYTLIGSAVVLGTVVAVAAVRRARKRPWSLAPATG